MLHYDKIKKQKMENEKPFQNIIDAVVATGIGFKTFFFRTNMSYDEIAGEETFIAEKFPTDDLRNGVLIIKFSDGKKHLGSLVLTQKQLESMVETCSGEIKGDKPFTLPLYDMGKRLFNTEMHIEMYLTFKAKKYTELDGTVGTAIVEVMPRRSKLKKWYAEGLSL